MSTPHPHYISVADLACHLGLSRIAILQRIKKGRIKAFKIGRSYAIARSYIQEFYPDFSLPTADPEEYVSVMQAAQILGLSRMSVYLKVKQGRIKAKKVGRHYVVAKKDLIEKQRPLPDHPGLERPYVSVMEYADLLAMSRKTVFHHIKIGKLKAKKIGRHYVIARTDISGIGEAYDQAAVPAEEFISVATAAQELGISRIAVFNRIKKGQMPAERIGRSYAIPRSFLIKGKK